MKQINYFSIFMSLLVMTVFASCSSTQYAAHFAPSKYDAHAQNNTEKASEGVLASQDAMEYEMEEIGERSGADEVNGDAVPRAAALKKLITETNMPDESELTARQQEILAETHERLQNMTRQEKRELKREIRNIKLSDYTKNLPAYDHLGITENQQVENTLLLVIATILIPPLGVFLHQGAINSKFWISLVLTLLFFIPGLIYSLIVVLGS